VGGVGGRYPLEFGHISIKVILDCAHFLEFGRFEYDNADEYGTRSRGWHWQLVASVAQQQEDLRLSLVGRWMKSMLWCKQPGLRLSTSGINRYCTYSIFYSQLLDLFVFHAEHAKNAKGFQVVRHHTI
jgi:hypothetical protein